MAATSNLSANDAETSAALLNGWLNLLSRFKSRCKDGTGYNRLE
jgi:hypothetical protein